MGRRPAPDLDGVMRLRAAGLQPTRQRLAVAAVMFARPVHLTADQVVRALHVKDPLAPAAPDADATPISRATIYATLAQFAQAGLLRELHTGGGAVVYDSNTTPHQHWVDVDSGEVHDLPPGVQLQVTGIDTLPVGLQVQDVQVMLRVKTAAA